MLFLSTIIVQSTLKDGNIGIIILSFPFFSSSFQFISFINKKQIRGPNLVREMRSYNSDIICLQVIQVSFTKIYF